MKPTIYGVTCRWEHNPRRSNFGGKSAFLEGVFKFALYGKHRKRTEDQWITKGEKEGGVKVILRDTSRYIVIKRTRRLGSSTKLVVEVMDLKRKLLEAKQGDEAQLYLEQLIGLGWEDFENSSFFTQKKMSRFITEDSGERMNIVTRWFRLGQLETAIDSVGEQLSRALKEVSELEQERRNCVNEMARILDTHGMEQVAGMMVADVSSTLTKLDEKLAELKGKAEQAAKDEQAFQEKRDSLATSKHLFDQAREYRETVDQGKALRKRVTAYLDDVPTEAHLASQKTLLRAITEELGAAQREVTTKAKLARGEFDGECPVAGVDCPIRKEINGETKKNAQLLAAATTEHNALAVRRKNLAEEIESAEEMLRQYEEDTEERGRLLEKVKKLEPASMLVASLKEMDFETALESAKASLRDAKEQAAAATKEMTVIETTRKLLVQLDEAFARADKALGEKCAHRDLLLDARRVLSEAVREISRVNLQAIEAGANYALAFCGIDLTVKATWERPTKSPEKNCSACGWAYPASRKVKVCELCGTARGTHMERKLEVEPSDESGGAEDLGGIALQLSAADWLRRDRGAACAFAELDEPFGALDAQHSADLASHLAMLLKYFGFEQAFVVAHSAGIMASMPDVVEIVAGPNGSRLVEGRDERTSGKVAVDGDGRDAEGNRTVQPRKRARSKNSDAGGAVRSEPSDRKNHGDEGRGKADSARPRRRADAKASGVASPRKGAAAKGGRRSARGAGR